jgi:hypothetical protein
MRFSCQRLLFTTTILLLLTVPLCADILLPGGNVSPDLFPNSGTPPLLDSATGTFDFGSGSGLITGTYFEAVAVDPFGVTCPGCLDFAFQVDLNSGLSAGIFHVILSRYTGYSTDVGYVDGTGGGGSSATEGIPIFVTRGPGGGGVNFVFSAPGNITNTIAPGGSSAILVIATNATTYDSLGTLQIDGGRGDNLATGQINSILEPTFQAVPEPSAVLVLSLALAAIALFGKKRSQQSSAR